jgi:hypothetical protein
MHLPSFAIFTFGMCLTTWFVSFILFRRVENLHKLMGMAIENQLAIIELIRKIACVEDKKDGKN